MENETLVTPAPTPTVAPVSAPVKSNMPIVIIGIVMVMLIVLVVVGYFVWQSVQLQPAPTVMPAQTSAVSPTPTPNYTNPFDTYENPFTQ